MPGPPDRPAEGPSSPAPPDRPAAAGDRARSRDDLHERLRQLPAGHPSSLERTAGEPSDLLLSADDPQRIPGDHIDATREQDAARRDYWNEVPGLLRAWAAHESTWPAERGTSAVDRSKDPPGAWRGDGNQCLGPEQHAQAKDVIADVRRVEKPITEHMREVERLNTCGGWLEGLEYRLKGEDRIKEKIADLAGTSAPDVPVESVARQIPDAIRFTFCVEADDYAVAYQEVKGRLEAYGYSMTYAQNHWAREEYKGVNTRWLTAEGQIFELQFHTPESFHAKQQVTHLAYERLRNPLTSEGERSILSAFQREVCAWIDVPDGADDIPSHREGDR